jgi:hypothetical protein
MSICNVHFVVIFIDGLFIEGYYKNAAARISLKISHAPRKDAMFGDHMRRPDDWSRCSVTISKTRVTFALSTVVDGGSCWWHRE